MIVYLIGCCGHGAPYKIVEVVSDEAEANKLCNNMNDSDMELKYSVEKWFVDSYKEEI